MSLEPSSSAPAGEVGAGYWAAREEAAAARVDDELSEEQFQGNRQIQEDELLALQAIYGDDMVNFDSLDGLRCFQISLHYHLQGEIQVYMNVGTNETTETGDEGDDEDADDGLLYACSLRHLPPITLTWLLPRSYPSTRAPYFAVAAKWLDEPELPGQEVVFRWADWLSGSSWSCIASDDQMVLGPDASSAGEDERAIGRSLILDSTIPLMHIYSEERSQETFDQSVHECGVCLSENTGRNFIRLPCDHSFCVKCMESYYGIHVKEGSVTRLACPGPSCRAPLPPPVLRRLLADEGYTRWESLALRRTLDTMPDVAYCPRCNAACVAAGDDAQCPACFFTFCARCGERRHVGDACVPAEDKLDDLLVRERQKLKASAREEQRSEAQRLREQRKVEELLSLREVLRSTRQCPACRMAIAKTEACNKTVCDNCGTFFCYRCSRAISGYKHFVNGECGLFERVGRGRLPGQQARVGNQDLDEDVEIEEPGWMRALRYTCPTCGAKRTKAGANNLLVCRACHTRYCALCWKRVWEVSQHYGPWGDCQQCS
ncbi:E3 ubiquitin-protein ligase RNF14-like [Panicum virgatum]|uniref:E3 ubiquitin-protein ligase RNF14-like n=1 Tax=Panicum virgatum TaxID=38727 RepID=UPI0019D68E8A|nr:E3 ubiquitin-protein ligase RNF14-like [Panicum virgatum]